MTTPFKFRYVHEIAGTFVIASVAIALIGLFLVGRSQRWFQETHELRVVLPTETPGGVRKGSQVKVIGTVVGQVRRIEAGVNAQTIAVAEIDDEMWGFVRQDSTAMIKKQFLVTGDAFIEITAGTGAPIGRGSLTATLAPDPSVVIQDSLVDVRDSLTNALNHINGLMNEYTQLARDLQDPEGPLMQVLHNTEEITRELRDPDGRLQSLLAELSRLATDLRAPDGSLQTLLTDASAIAADLEAGEGTAGRLLKDATIANTAERTIEEIDVAVREVRTILADLQEATERLPRMIEIAADEMEQTPGTVAQTQDTLRDVETLAEAIKRHWLISGYVEPDVPAARLAPSDLDLPIEGATP